MRAGRCSKSRGAARERHFGTVRGPTRLISNDKAQGGLKIDGERPEIKQHKPLPPPNSDFYQLRMSWAPTSLRKCR